MTGTKKMWLRSWDCVYWATLQSCQLHESVRISPEMPGKLQPTEKQHYGVQIIQSFIYNWPERI